MSKDFIYDSPGCLAFQKCQMFSQVAERVIALISKLLSQKDNKGNLHQEVILIAGDAGFKIPRFYNWNRFCKHPFS